MSKKASHYMGGALFLNSEMPKQNHACPIIDKYTNRQPPLFPIFAGSQAARITVRART